MVKYVAEKVHKRPSEICRISSDPSSNDIIELIFDFIILSDDPNSYVSPSVEDVAKAESEEDLLKALGLI